ncbi:MAG: NADPH-dependent oxidoreductase, partial [Eubacteriales bacterium]|nr:NADPH-dependent oxidoreductase [Eubacteriales bacterium]
NEKKLVRLAGQIDSSNPPRMGFKTKFIFNLMRMTHIKGWDSSPREKEYWEERGWLGKKRPWNR